jgi:orotidine-5'-phosphate decarboxylase
MSTIKAEFYSQLYHILEERSPLCVGLDPDLELLPSGYSSSIKGLEDHMLDIIDATSDLAAAYKMNIAFFEAMGAAGWNMIERLVAAIRRASPALIIADAKRGDLYNTARFYSRTFFDTFHFDAVTLQPYMGYDSLKPFLERTDRGSIILCLTSNDGALDFQYHGHPPLFVEVARRCAEWSRNNVMLVVGATRNPDDMKKIREAAPQLPFLVPGIGKQGGDLETVLSICGRRLLLNSSRSISAASADRSTLKEAARSEARRIVQSFKRFFGEPDERA